MPARLRVVMFIAAVLFCLKPGEPARAQESEDAGQPPQVLVLTRLPLDSTQQEAYGRGKPNVAAQDEQRRIGTEIANRHGLKLVDDWPLPRIALDCFVMSVPDGRGIEETVRELSNDPRIAFAEPMHIYRTQGAPAAYNDPLFLAEPAAAGWRLANLHRLSTGRGISVAVIDSGIEANHPDLAGQIRINRNFVSGRALVAEPHGTGVAGVIAARSNNGVGIVGIAPGARLLGLRACWQAPGSLSAYCDTLSLAKALYFAMDSKAPVINLSLSGPNDHLLAELLRIVLAHGVKVVAAYDPALPDGGFPASLPGVISVSNDLAIARRPGIYLAPGRDVITTQPGGRWSLVAGSSYSAAHVSGLFALLLGMKSGRRAQLIAARTNGGAIDACASLMLASGLCACACTPAPGAQAGR